MQREVLLGVIVLLAVSVTVPAAGAGPARTNEAPLADAGLDQQAVENTTVYLDAGGSLDPDGSIESYRWEIERPDGTTARPSCPTCVRTDFVPMKPGRYAVTVTVTDDDGAASSDTLFVEVNAVEGPSASLSGPDRIPAGETDVFEASASAGDRELQSVTWHVDGIQTARQPISADSATVNRSIGFAGEGNHTVSVLVVDAAGRTERKGTIVTVEPRSDGGNVASSAAVADTAIVFEDYILLDEGTLDQDGFGMNLGEGSKDTRIASDGVIEALDRTDALQRNPNSDSYRIPKNTQTGQEMMTVLENSETTGAGGYTRSKDDILGSTNIPIAPSDTTAEEDDVNHRDDHDNNSKNGSGTDKPTAGGQVIPTRI